MTDKEPTYEAYFPTPGVSAPAEKSPLLTVVEEFRDLLAERDKSDDDRADDQYKQFFSTAGDGTESTEVGG